MEPNFTGLMENAGDVVSFLGIPVVLMNYSGTLVPAIISVLIYSKLEKLLKRFIPKSIELFALSFVALIIMVPLSTMLIGPLGVYLANGVGNIVNFLAMKNGLLTGLVIGGGWTALVLFGIHWGVVPIMVNNISTYGYDYIRPMVAAATFASAGAAFGVFLKSKNKETKAFALSSTFPALLGGITEPIVYGVSLKYKKPFIAQIIGGALAGAFMGAMHTKAIVYVFPALTTLPAFFCETFMYYVIGIAAAFLITAALTYIFGINETEEEIDTTTEDATMESSTGASISPDTTLYSCLKGETVALENVNDEVFASKAMGDGIAIIPKEGILYAPTDATVAAVFPTGHAIGLKTTNGTELLMHIGINTVEMNGKGFRVLVETGKNVKKGDKLVEFDLETIKEAGYDTTTMMILSDMANVEKITFSDKVTVDSTDWIMKIRRTK